MRTFFVEKKIEKITYIIQIVITSLLLIGIIIGLIDLFKYFYQILIADPAESYALFQSFLGYALILVVGIELILMILYHSTKAILELVLFVIARKMLVYSNTMFDLVLGTIAIAIVFATLRFLVQKDGEDIVKRENPIYSATTKIKDLLSSTGINIPADKGQTVGDLVHNLSVQSDKPIKEGAEFNSGDAKIRVTKSTDDGHIKEVMITSNKESDKMQEGTRE